MLEAKTPNLWDIQKLNSTDRREITITTVFKELKHEYSKFSNEVYLRFNREYRRKRNKKDVPYHLFNDVLAAFRRVLKDAESTDESLNKILHVLDNYYRNHFSEISANMDRGETWEVFKMLEKEKAEFTNLRDTILEGNYLC